MIQSHMETPLYPPFISNKQRWDLDGSCKSAMMKERNIWNSTVTQSPETYNDTGK